MIDNIDDTPWLGKQWKLVPEFMFSIYWIDNFHEISAIAKQYFTLQFQINV